MAINATDIFGVTQNTHTAGSTPKHMISLNESICMPNVRSSLVRSFFVDAMVPSNISQTPASIRQISEPTYLSFMASITPRKPIHIPMYVSTTV